MPPLNPWELFCYGLLSLPIAMGGFALVTYIPTYYAVDLGLGLSLVGLIFVIGRLLDIITDPVIGYLSDKTQTKWGPRRPWMVLGVPLFCLAAGALFMPPDDPSLLYLALASAAYFLFYTALDTPYSSVGLEISPYVHERSILASVKGAFQVLGALAAAFIPFIFLLDMKASLILISQIIFCLSVFALLFFLKFVPRKTDIRQSQPPNFFRSFKTAWSNRYYRFLITAFCVVQTANALIAALTVLYVTNIIKVPGLTGLFLGVLFLSSVLFFPVWLGISRRWSKKTAWATSIIIAITMLLIVPFLGEGDVPAVFVFCIVIGASFGCDAIMPTSMLADIVYKDEIDCKGRPAALYLAMKNALSKLTFVAPMGLAFPVLDFVGFVSGGSNTLAATSTLLFFYAGLPVILRLIAIAIVLKMPKTEALHK